MNSGWRRLVVAGLVAGLVVVPSAPVVATATNTETGLRPLEDALRRVAGTGLIVERGGVDGSVTFLGGPRPLTRPDDGDPDEIATEFVEHNGALFGADGEGSELVTLDTTATEDGGGAVRFQQEIDGVPVLAGQLVVRVDEQGSVRSSAGEALPETAVDTSPTITAGDAAAAAITETVRQDDVDAGALVTPTPELWIYDPALIGAPDVGRPRLVWRTAVRTVMGDVDRLVLVDARTGGIALSFSQVHAADSQVCDNANTVRTSYAQGLCPSAYQTVVKSDTVNLGPGSEALTAYTLSEAVQAFYATLGRNSIDDAGMAVVSTVRFCITGGCPFENAFWNGQQMVYGTNYASADDVVAHELTHGVTQYESQLLYYSESGAINESLSDVFGELFDLSYNTGADAPADRWRMGEDLPIGEIRDMEDPTVFGDPDRMTSALYWATPDDEYGVHINSGVNNKAAFLITDGGTFNGQTITGLGISKASWVYYEAQTSLLTAGSDYLDLYVALPQACTNLVGQHGITTSDCTSVAQAVTATEMHLDPAVSGARLRAAECPAGQVRTSTVYSNDMEASSGWTTSSTNAAYAWTYTTDSSQSGTTSMWADDPAVLNQSTVTMAASINVPSADTYVRFDHSFSFDTSGDYPSLIYWDGGLVRYSANGGAFTNIGSLAGAGAVNGYNGTLRTAGSDNAYKGQSAFVGNSPGYQETRYKIGALAGQTFKLQFLLTTDSTVGYPGWEVDDVEVYTCGAATAPGAPTGVVATPGTGAVFLAGAAVDGSGQHVVHGAAVRRSPIVTGDHADRERADGRRRYDLDGDQGRRTSSASSTVVLGTAPGAHQRLDLHVDRSAALTWTAPASDGGGDPTYLSPPSSAGSPGADHHRLDDDLVHGHLAHERGVVLVRRRGAEHHRGWRRVGGEQHRGAESRRLHRGPTRSGLRYPSGAVARSAAHGAQDTDRAEHTVAGARRRSAGRTADPCSGYRRRLAERRRDQPGSERDSSRCTRAARASWSLR